MHTRYPVIRPTQDGARYELVESFDFYGHQVLQGFIFDGASVPRILWRVVPPGRPWLLRASCGHDWMYENALETKQIADSLFHRALLEDGAKTWLAKAMHIAVCLGGNGNYVNTSKHKIPPDGRK